MTFCRRSFTRKWDLYNTSRFIDNIILLAFTNTIYYWDNEGIGWSTTKDKTSFNWFKAQTVTAGIDEFNGLISCYESVTLWLIVAYMEQLLSRSVHNISYTFN